VDREAATWLRDELKSRFDKPIKYLIYSHDHADHISGGEVFAEAGATVVAHELTKSQIISNNRPTAIPSLTFSDSKTIELGGKTVELLYAGLSHSDNSIMMNFTDERTVYVVDFITVKRMPYRDLGNSCFPEWIDAIKKVESLDFEILAPGHGALGTRADAAEHRQYIEDLYSQIQKARKAGKSVEEMKQSIKMEEYSHFGQFEAWLPLNIEGMNRSIDERK
jgi:glyoxylase-like metal-dependent hydrolase (beta-lactamase superfamily II)